MTNLFSDDLMSAADRRPIFLKPKVRVWPWILLALMVVALLG